MVDFKELILNLLKTLPADKAIVVETLRDTTTKQNTLTKFTDAEVMECNPALLSFSLEMEYETVGGNIKIEDIVGVYVEV